MHWGPNLARTFNTDGAASPLHPESPPRVYSEQGGREERGVEVVERMREGGERRKDRGGRGDKWITTYQYKSFEQGMNLSGS